jgi:hypothetical protein
MIMITSKSNQRGVSVIEALISIAIISVVVVMISQFNTSFSIKDRSMRRACESHAQSIINQVQEESYYRAVVNFAHYNPAVRPSFGALTATTGIGVAGNWWAGPVGNYTIATASGVAGEGTLLKNSLLIEGSLRTLASIYTMDANTRCNASIAGNIWNNYPALTGLAAPDELTRRGPVRARMQITPYDRNTEAATCPAPPLFIAPLEEGNTTAKSVFVNGSGVPVYNAGQNIGPAIGGLGAAARIGTRPPDVFSNLGVELAVQVEYQEVDGQVTTCNVSQKFEYPRDGDAPNPPAVSVVTNPTNPATGANNCVPNRPDNATVRIQYGSANEERGIQVLCRDLSFFYTYFPTGGAPYNQIIGSMPAQDIRPCIRGGAVQGSVIRYGPNNLPGSGASRVNQWVPCYQLRQCGKPPVNPPSLTGGLDVANTGGGPFNLDLSYTNLGYGCVMNFEAVVVDTAGNSSVQNGRAILQTAVGATRDNEIQFAGCGVLCAPPSEGAWPYPNPPYNGQFPNGYYTCRSGGNGPCCSGVGCTPYN